MVQSACSSCLLLCMSCCRSSGASDVSAARPACAPGASTTTALHARASTTTSDCPRAGRILARWPPCERRSMMVGSTSAHMHMCKCLSHTCCAPSVCQVFLNIPTPSFMCTSALPSLSPSKHIHLHCEGFSCKHDPGEELPEGA